MKVLLTGSDGYIGTVLSSWLRGAGHSVVGLDSALYAGCDFDAGPATCPELAMDVRDVGAGDLVGVDAVVHLAGISNDPLGDLDPTTTYEVNHRATVDLAERAKDAGVRRFVFSSSCSLYGSAGDELIDESAPARPVTPYGESKIMAERDLSALADERFSPTHLRNATVYGASPRLRGDLVVNNLTGLAVTTGEVLLRSDGTPWRPLVHVEDVCRAFLAVVEAPIEVVHDEAFNVGRTEDNLQVRTVAEMVGRAVAGSRVGFASDAGPDRRDYRVDCSKLPAVLPAARPRWDVAAGITQLRDAMVRSRLTLADLTGSRLQRIARVRELQESGRLGTDLRWLADRAAVPMAGA